MLVDSLSLNLLMFELDYVTKVVVAQRKRLHLLNHKNLSHQTLRAFMKRM